MNPDHAIDVIGEQLDKFGPFANADADAVAAFAEAFKTFADKVAGKVSASSGVEVYIIEGNMELNTAPAINDLIAAAAKNGLTSWARSLKYAVYSNSGLSYWPIPTRIAMTS
jgi:hypothetical protein